MQGKTIDFIDITERVAAIRDEPWRLYWFSLDIDEETFLRDPGPLLVASKLVQRASRITLRVANAYVPQSESTHLTGISFACRASFSTVTLFRHPKDPAQFQFAQGLPARSAADEPVALKPIYKTLVDISAQVPELNGEPWRLYWTELSADEIEEFMRAPREHLQTLDVARDVQHVTVHIANPWVPLHPGPCCQVVCVCLASRSAEVIFYRHETPVDV